MHPTTLPGYFVVGQRCLLGASSGIHLRCRGSNVVHILEDHTSLPPHTHTHPCFRHSHRSYLEKRSRGSGCRPPRRQPPRSSKTTARWRPRRRLPFFSVVVAAVVRCSSAAAAACRRSRHRPQVYHPSDRRSLMSAVRRMCLCCRCDFSLPTSHPWCTRRRREE